MTLKNNQYILLTVDVEDWFQVENFKSCIPVSSWPSLELRVERNTQRWLDFFDSASAYSPHGRGSLKATFFILGWVAERLPNLVRKIAACGHEVASHGFGHELCFNLSAQALKTDLINSKNKLENILGNQIEGYRAPSFSVSDAVLSIIAECGYRYDSSYNSFALHDRYGRLQQLPLNKNGISLETKDGLIELPISNLKLGRSIFPWGGGGYFRLFPFPIFKLGVKHILSTDRAFLFYSHSWEIDPDQPRMNQASPFYRFRHYVNLKQTLPRLSALIRSFPEAQFITCQQYLDVIGVRR